MSARPRARLRAGLAGLMALLLAAGVLATGALLSPAAADSAPLVPTDPTTPTTVSADPLPTVQINGVAWSQVVVGNTVYVAGRFTSARPAGAAAGTNETPRNNLLAYDIRTGTLITSFAPDLNGQALVVTASPDGSRIYVGGDFTTANGQTRSRIAAYSTATGALVPDFRPVFSTTVRALVATDSTVYAGGNFAAVGGVSRSRLAAVSAANGALLPWAPVAGAGVNANGSIARNSSVDALVLTSGGTQVVAGGRFGTMNGTATSGVAALDASSGASLPFAVGQQISNQGDNSAVTSLSTDGTTVWMSGYDYYGPGNLEGVVAATAAGGRLVWMADCHGDTYSTFPHGGSVYIAGHPHQCQNIGGFPETNPAFNYYGLAYTKAVSPTNTVGTGGFEPRTFTGAPAPEVSNWYPRFYSGTFTGQSQAGWSVTGNADYVVYGGEFPAVNNTFQQGLVRFAVPRIAPNKVAPNRPAAGWTPSAVALDGGAVRVSWPTVSDRDNRDLVYRVYRDGSATPLHTSQPEDSTFFRVRTLSFTDTGRAAGATHRYQVQATDAFGNTLTSETVSVTASTVAASDYATRVRADGASSHWSLHSLTGSTSYDQVGLDDVTVRSGLRAGSGSPLGTTSLTADGTTAARGTVAAASAARVAPDTFSLELWFSTTSTTGGRLAGYGNSATGDNSAYDRMLMMDREGRLVFGVYTGATQTISTGTGLNDGAWHHVVAQLGPAGQTLYVDGVRVGTRAGVTAGQAYSGWWQLGGGSMGGWPVDRSTEEFTGQLAQVAVYPTVLSAAQVRSHLTATGRTPSLVPAPTDTYGAAVAADQPVVQWRLDDAPGATRAAGSDETGAAGRVVGDVGRAAGVPLPGHTSTAYDLAGRGGYVVADRPTSNPTTFSTEVWFSTTSTAGGRLIGLGNSQDARSSNYDRMVYLLADGRLRFGVWAPGAAVVDSTRAYNDGGWHHVVATFGPAGMALYVDGALVGTNSTNTVAAYSGSAYWRLGADHVWDGAGTAALDGRLDEAAVYDRALTGRQVAAHWAAAQAPVDTPPTASFTAAVDGMTVAVDGRGSTDAQGPIAGWAWDFGDGATATGPTAAHTYTDAGSHTVTLRVTDGAGQTTATRQTVTVVAPVPNVPPTADFAATPADLAVAVDGRASADTDGTVTSWAWDFGDGGTATGPTATHRYAAAGSYRVTLTVTDDAGATGTATRTVTVTAPNQPPTASFTTGSTGLVLDVDGGASADADGTVTGWAWDFGDGGTATGRTAQHTYAAAGTYPVALTVTDDRGATAVSTQTVTVAPVPAPNRAPTAAFTATATDLTVQLDGRTSTDTDGTVTSWAWDLGDGTTATGPTVTHRYATPGTATVTLTVTDDAGATGTTTSTVTTTAPANVAPTAAFTATVTERTALLDGTGSRDPDGRVVGYAWDFGDGSQGTGATVSHAYGTHGSFTVTLTVTDDRGATASSSSVVRVAPTAVARDAFERTRTAGWGPADVGGTWVATDGGTASSRVSGGTGLLTTAPARSAGTRLDVGQADLSLQATVALQSAPTGGGTYVNLLARTAGTSDYRARLHFLANGTVSTSVSRVVSGTETVLSTTNAGRYAVGQTLAVRLDLTTVGTGTSLQLRVWPADGAEPGTWAVTATDSTQALQRVAGGVGVLTYQSGSAAGSQTVAVDDVWVGPAGSSPRG